MSSKSSIAGIGKVIKGFLQSLPNSEVGKINISGNGAAQFCFEVGVFC